ncbi:MAG: SLBB domain-containing protein [Prevotella sp.]|nr:SLBB domain-containing protein [Prevotella sp.]
MKKYSLFLLMLFVVLLPASAQMSDQQAMTFIQQEMKAGTSQSQIVTKLMQKGVKIEQIRRLRNQYDKELKARGAAGAADAAVSAIDARMRSNGTGQQAQDVVVGKEGSTQAQLEQEADIQYAEIQQNINQHVDGEVGEAKLKVFGRDIFNNKLLSFEPNMNIATPQNYVLGPGDVVIIDIYGASQKSESLTVSPDGDITVPGYGPIKVSGLSVASAQSKIRSTLGSRYASSSLKISVGQTRSIMVNVMGEVKAPGNYTLSAFATVFHALYMAGGINDLGTLRNIKVFRGGKQITVVDVYEYILNGRLAGNIRLQENDVIVVGPYDCLVGVQGNVKRPMFYEMRPSESVAQIIKNAGGFTGDAYKKSVRLVRKSGERYSVHNVEEFDMSSFKLSDGDVVTVDGMINRYENMVEVKGAVFRPGQFELGKTVTSVRSLIEAADGLTEDAFTARGVMYRMKEDRTLETMSLDIAGIMAGSVADIPLKNEDVLFIPTQSDRIAERTFTITGEVMSPGTYAFSDNTTIEDLIVMAGGLTDQASMAKVDVSRRIIDPKSVNKTSEIAKTFSFSIKDGLMIDGDRGFLLEPYDVVHVRRSPAFSTARNITVTGEVNYEGNFTLESKNMRLSDAVKMAGGISDAAYLRGARLVRVMNDEERVRQQATLEAIRNILTERGDSIDTGKLELGDTYTVGIYLDEALNNPGGNYDILLREGDQLFVPEYNGTVKISGDVFFPNTVSFINGKKASYYVDQAGGYGNRAKKSKTFIVYQNGTIGLASKGAKPEPGCEIIVPSKKRKNPLNLGGLISAGTGLASLATMVVALTKL